MGREGRGGRAAPLTSVGAVMAREGAAQPSGRARQEKGGAVVEGVGVALGVAGGVGVLLGEKVDVEKENGLGVKDDVAVEDATDVKLWVVEDEEEVTGVAVGVPEEDTVAVKLLLPVDVALHEG